MSKEISAGEEVMKAARASEEKASRSVWLHAWHDPVAGLKAFTPSVRMCDLSGDGECKLLVASSDKKLKIYTGTTLLSENVLLDAPVSICTFYPDAKAVPRVPNVAVAAGAFVFIYRNLRPWYKFALPPGEVHPEESRAWEAVHSGSVSIPDTQKKLAAARDEGVKLTSTSQDLLAIDDAEVAGAFVEEQRDKPLTATTVCTCMEVLKKDLEDDDAVSMLVVGTESGQVMVLDPSGQSVAKNCKWQLPSAPVYMAVTGVKDIEFRIVCACRDGNVHTIKESGPSGVVIELESMPCGLVRQDKHIIVGCMSNAVHAYTLRGKKAYSIYLPDPISCMELLELRKTRVAKAMIVGMNSGEIRLYGGSGDGGGGKHLLVTIRINEPVTALRFGSYGREEGCLAIVGASGSLSIKMLQRTAKFDSAGATAGPPPEQDVPLSIPKKTKLYVEQTQREREQATEMHRAFQRDLCKLRLSTARAYVKMITDGQGPMSYSSGSALRLTAQVQGLGPKFKIKLSLQNTGSKAADALSVALNYNPLLYRVKTAVFEVPLLVPGLIHRIDAELECVDENGTADVVRVFVCPQKSVVPLLSAIVNMPTSEMLLGVQ